MAQNESNFDKNPPIDVSKYDESIRLFCAAYEPLFTMSYSALRSSLGDNANLLIVGAGTGMEICTFGRMSPNWSMTGVDPSAEMLSIAKKAIADNCITSNINLCQGYTHDLPETDMFDAATCILVMHFLLDDGAKLQLLESISSRLRSGAPFVLVDGFGVSNSIDYERNLSAWKTFVVANGVDPEIVEDGFCNQILKRLQLVSEERIVSLLNEAGFEKPTRFFTSFLYGGWIATKK
jgi:tRNA (cmo5U34)-methyltransferase